MRTSVCSGTGWSNWRQAPDSEMSSRFATPFRMRPDLSFQCTSTMSAQSIRGSIRLSNIYFLSACCGGVIMRGTRRKAPTYEFSRVPVKYGGYTNSYSRTQRTVVPVSVVCLGYLSTRYGSASSDPGGGGADLRRNTSLVQGTHAAATPHLVGICS